MPNSNPKKVSQYADDITVITENKNCLNSLWKILSWYENITGSKVNEGKTEILLVGKWTNRQRELIPKQYRKYIKDSIKILGLHHGKNSQNLNEDMIAQKMDIEIEKWKDRSLSMRGKVTIMRSVILSKIWHVAKVNSLHRKLTHYQHL